MRMLAKEPMTLWLLLACWSSNLITTPVAAAWSDHSLQTFRRAPRRQMTATDDQRVDTTSTSTSTENILEDGEGHINRDLAERIWNWEQDRRKVQELPKLDYSVRAGLRLVDSIVEEMTADTTTGGARKNDADGNSDLVQEGLTALLDAMSHYRSHEQEDFETYARENIRERLAAAMDQDVRRPLPNAVKNVVQEAKRLMAKRLKDHPKAKATWSAVAEELNLPLERLQTYLRLAKRTGTLSVESTVEIMNPMLEDSSPAYRDQDEWELQEGKLLDDGRSIRKDELIDEYLDEMIEHEGDDEAWVQREQIAGPLSALIPDTNEPSPDDVVIQELIRRDLSSFLDASLDSNEVKVIRSTFGLESGTSQSATETANELGMEAHEVADILTSALDKLRHSYLARFIPAEDDGDVEDSV